MRYSGRDLLRRQNPKSLQDWCSIATYDRERDPAAGIRRKPLQDWKLRGLLIPSSSPPRHHLQP